MILADGSLWTWGRNDTQQLGLDQTAPTVSLPAQVPAVTQAAAVGTGTYQTVCLLSDDTLFSWGPQAMGLLGGGAVDAVIVDKPVAVSYAESNKGFTVLDEGLGAEQYGIAFRAGDEELCATVEDAVAQLVANGTYAEIAAKYPDIANNLTLLG